MVKTCTLFVTDTNNHRVLVWNAIPTTSVSADFAVGQPDLTHNASAASQSGFHAPFMAVSDGTRLFASDQLNNRVLVWDPLPTASGQPATAVFGQASFTASTADGDRKVDGASVDIPTGLYTDGARVFVADANNDRILIFPSAGVY